MRPPSSSKNPRKISEDDRSRKKKSKSKSSKRRRDDPSISSSSDSESELESRSRRKSFKSKKIEKKWKESRKSEKRRSRKKKSRRGLRESSSSSFSGGDDSGPSCSTCSDSDRSRSPVRKSKSKSRKREGKRYLRYESKRSRYRSTSCSTCSGARSRSRSRSPIVDRSRGSSRGRSSIKDASGGIRERSPVSAGGRSPWEERYGERRFSSSPERSQLEESHREVVETRRLKSVLAVPKPSDEDEAKIIRACDDYPASESNEGNNNRQLQVSEMEDLNDNRARDREIATKDMGRAIVARKDYSLQKESEAVGEDCGKEADDLELILRQKALENFRKFRRGHSFNKETLSNAKDESSKLESREISPNIVKTSESKHSGSLDNQRLAQGEAIKVDNRPIGKNGVGRTKLSLSVSNDIAGVTPVASSRNTSSHLESSNNNKVMSEETSSAKDEQSRRLITQPDGGKVRQAKVDTASGASNVENQSYKSNESAVESASGSQFEQKTFSRVCDGEKVQVSYTVYIPKKTPALARRQLQR